MNVSFCDRFESGARKQSVPLSLMSSHGAPQVLRPYSSADCAADHPSAEELEREKSVATGAILDTEGEVKDVLVCDGG